MKNMFLILICSFYSTYRKIVNFKHCRITNKKMHQMQKWQKNLSKLLLTLIVTCYRSIFFIKIYSCYQCKSLYRLIAIDNIYYSHLCQFDRIQQKAVDLSTYKTRIQFIEYPIQHTNKFCGCHLVPTYRQVFKRDCVDNLVTYGKNLSGVCCTTQPVAI